MRLHSRDLQKNSAKSMFRVVGFAAMKAPQWDLFRFGHHRAFAVLGCGVLTAPLVAPSLELLLLFHSVRPAAVLLHDTAGNILTTAGFARMNQFFLGLFALALSDNFGVAAAAEVDGFFLQFAKFESL
jgi:hypothetical protein